MGVRSGAFALLGLDDEAAGSGIRRAGFEATRDLHPLAVAAAGLVSTLQGPGPFTVFAPTDEAFAKIPKDQLDALIKDKAKLSSVLTYHVVPGLVLAKDVKAGEVMTVQGSKLSITTNNGVMVDNAKVVSTDVMASNGVIHVIDTVIMPK